MNEYICRSCSHIFEVHGSQACPYCGSENTGMYSYMKTHPEYVPNTAALRQEQDVYDQIHMGISFRLAYGHRLIRKAGDQ
jgi:hypothetical protein